LAALFAGAGKPPLVRPGKRMKSPIRQVSMDEVRHWAMSSDSLASAALG
jgi:hypothetical protein